MSPTLQQMRLEIHHLEQRLVRLQARLSKEMLSGDREAARATLLELDTGRAERKHLLAEYAKASYLKPK